MHDVLHGISIDHALPGRLDWAWLHGVKPRGEFLDDTSALASIKWVHLRTCFLDNSLVHPCIFVPQHVQDQCIHCHFIT